MQTRANARFRVTNAASTHTLRLAAVLLVVLMVAARTFAAGDGLPERHRRALLVAVNGYHRASEDPGDAWISLNTLPDVLAIKSELIRRFHFSADDIKVLSTPAETTHASIVGWFRKWLIDDTVPGRGDEIYFHYSGHGGEVPNDNTLTGDLDPFHEPDGLDRTLIPSDFGHKNYYSATVKIPKIGGKPVCNEIRDSELKRLLVQLEAKEPGNVFLTFDCCHAGGNTRGSSGAAAVRGDIWHGPEPLKRPASGSGPFAGTRGGADSGGVAGINTRQFPGFVVLAATNSDQLDFETVSDDGKSHMGALSYALCEAMDRATPLTSYRDLMSEVNTIMAVRVPAQTPQIEGPIDRAVFDGTAIPPQPTIDIVLRDPDDSTDSASPDVSKLRPMLNAGYLQGMVKGSKVALRWLGEPVGAVPFAMATLDEVRGLESTLAFDPPTANGLTKDVILGALRGVAGASGKQGIAPRAAYAVLTKQLYPNVPLAVSIASDVPVRYSAALRSALDRLQSENWASAAPSDATRWDLKVQTAAAARREMPVTRGGAAAFPLPKDDNALVIAENGGGYIVPAVAGHAPTPVQIEGAIRGEARHRLFASLESPRAVAAPETKYQVEFRFVPVQVETEIDADGKRHYKQGSPILDKPQSTTARVNHFTEGDLAGLEIRNIGTQPAYITILNLRGDGTVHAVYPSESEEADNLILAEDYRQPAAKRKWQRLVKRDGNPYVFQFTNKDDNGVPFPTQADIYKVFVTKDKADFRLLIDPEARGTRGVIAGADSPLGRLIQRATAASRGAAAIEAPPAIGWSVRTVTYEVDPASAAP